ncbi:MAG: N-acetylglucosamine-6-phosphate deacetylase [Sphaerochaetaceae bacterium]|nr:N-acetylglucosamine-6-phosphate deacetylase [Sphaerochaetaceae bacterium]
MSQRSVIKNANIISGFAVLNDCGIFIEDGFIADIFSMKRYESKDFPSDTVVFDAGGATVCPGLIDTHIHGVCGFGVEDMTSEAILGMSRALVEFGVTSFIPTVYPDGKEKLFVQEEAICSAMGNETGAKILGINVEGPFISQKRPGALPLESISPVDIEYFDEIIDHGHEHVICMTVAPELKHMHELALRAKSRHVTLLAGHTDASYENMMEGMQCGILHSTHFFNAMSRLHHRNPGTVGAILIHPDMCCEIIADGVHVHPELVKMVTRMKPAENIVLITDSLKPNHQKDGKLFANGVEVVMGKDGAFVSASDETLLNGSALTLNKAIYNMKQWGISPEVTVQMATESPARIYGFDSIGVLVPGNRADISVFDDNFDPLAVFIDGNPVLCRI